MRNVKRAIHPATAFALLLSLSFQASAQTVAPQTSPVPTVVSTNAQAGDVLTLEAATEQFLRRNLSLEAARLEIGVAEAERIGARFRPRPGLTVNAENLKLGISQQTS